MNISSLSGAKLFFYSISLLTLFLLVLAQPQFDYILKFVMLPSTFGLFLGFIFHRNKHTISIAFALPVLILLGITFYADFFIPYHGGGASLSPIIIIIHGPVVSICSGICCELAIYISKRFFSRSTTHA